MLDRIGDGYVALDRTLTVTDASDRACVLLGRTREAMLGRPLWQMFPAGAGGSFGRALRCALDERREIRIEDCFEPLQ